MPGKEDPVKVVLALVTLKFDGTVGNIWEAGPLGGDEKSVSITGKRVRLAWPLPEPSVTTSMGAVTIVLVGTPSIVPTPNHVSTTFGFCPCSFTVILSNLKPGGTCVSVPTGPDGVEVSQAEPVVSPVKVWKLDWLVLSGVGGIKRFQSTVSADAFPAGKTNRSTKHDASNNRFMGSPPVKVLKCSAHRDAVSKPPL